MGHEFNMQESSTLYGLLAEGTTDIILKTDCDGFIRHASPGIEQLGILLPDMLIWPHILDLVDDAFQPAISAAHRAAVRGEDAKRWIEFSSVTNDGRERWFAIRMRSLIDDQGSIYGALSILRNIDETRALRERLFAAELTDPLTRLTNRHAFISMLQYLVECGAEGWLALFDIDYFKAINMRYGLSTGDKILVAFAEFLRSLADADSIISRVGAQRFGILLPDATPDRAKVLCEEIVFTLAELGFSQGPTQLPITASAGVARIGGTLDATIKTAEVALFSAKAKGRNCIEMARK
jgi:diguanylate cyclase (GGDEF)-like protein/PAS domain S-box-containing protein